MCNRQNNIVNRVEGKNYNSGHRTRLRQRYMKSGMNGLLDYELLELILTYAIPRKDVKPIAKTLCSCFGNINGVMRATPAELKKVNGIGDTSALLISLFKQVELAGCREKIERAGAVNSISDTFSFLKVYFECCRSEKSIILLYGRNGALVSTEAFNGNSTAVLSDISGVAELAMRAGAAKIITAHNHPEGKLEFSEEDIELCKKLNIALNILGIELYDCIIVGGSECCSWRGGY